MPHRILLILAAVAAIVAAIVGVRYAKNRVFR
jgi:hypothetical protein